MVLNRETVLRSLRAEQARLSREYHVAALALFGSVARGQEGPNSDLDILVDFTPEASLFDHNGLNNDLEAFFGVKVDVVPRDSIRKEFRDRILAEAVPV